MTADRRSERFVAALVVVVACGLTACVATDSPGVANVTTTTSRTANGASTATTMRKNDAAQSLIEWANCMRSHGDPNQSDPSIDAAGGININIPSSAESLSHAVHNGTAPCNNYLAAASAALRAGATDLTPPDQAALVRYSECMRANGVPSYPDPGTGGTTNLQAAGIDPNSPFFLRANNVCGKKIDAPSWWISGAGPPGDISVRSGPICPASGCPPRKGASSATGASGG